MYLRNNQHKFQSLPPYKSLLALFSSLPIPIAKGVTRISHALTTSSSSQILILYKPADGRSAAEYKFRTHFEWLRSKIPASVGPVLPSWSLLSINEKRAALTRGRLLPPGSRGKVEREEMERGKLLRYFLPRSPRLSLSLFKNRLTSGVSPRAHNYDSRNIWLIFCAINRPSATFDKCTLYDPSYK